MQRGQVGLSLEGGEEQRERQQGGWSRVRGGRSYRDARRARVPSRGTESRER